MDADAVRCRCPSWCARCSASGPAGRSQAGRRPGRRHHGHRGQAQPGARRHATCSTTPTGTPAGRRRSAWSARGPRGRHRRRRRRRVWPWRTGSASSSGSPAAAGAPAVAARRGPRAGDRRRDRDPPRRRGVVLHAPGGGARFTLSPPGGGRVSARRLPSSLPSACSSAGCGVPTGGEPATIPASDVPYGLASPQPQHSRGADRRRRHAGPARCLPRDAGGPSGRPGGTWTAPDSRNGWPTCSLSWRSDRPAGAGRRCRRRCPRRSSSPSTDCRAARRRSTSPAPRGAPRRGEPPGRRADRADGDERAGDRAVLLTPAGSRSRRRCRPGSSPPSR